MYCIVTQASNISNDNKNEEVIPSRTLFSTASSTNDDNVNLNDGVMLLSGGEALSQDHGSPLKY